MITKAPIAILAGEGHMPRLMLEACHAKSLPVFMLAIKGLVAQELLDAADDSVSLHVTQVGKAIKECLKRGVTQIAFAGRLQHKSIFNLSLLHMDLTTLKIWHSSPDKRADTLLGQLCAVFEEQGISVMKSLDVLNEHVATKGVLTSCAPSDAALEDMHFGYVIAKELGAIDAGQSVVIRNKSIVALEAMEGTDKCIARAGELVSKGAVLVKVAKPKQDPRFDVPVIGVHTVEAMAAIGGLGIAVEAGKTLILDKAATLRRAEQLSIPIVGL